MSSFIPDLLEERSGQTFDLHEAHLNTQMVRVLKAIGYDRVYTRAEGPYLYDQAGQQYLDLLSGFGVYALGRNHPVVIDALKDVLSSHLPDMVQMDVSLLSGLLGEALLARCPEKIDKMFFCNSGTEAVEAAIKFARYTTRRDRIVYCEHGYHGLTLGALSLNGENVFREGFGSLLPGCSAVPFNDLDALERALKGKDVAAFIVEPIQGKGVNMPTEEFLPGAAKICAKYGTLLVADGKILVATTDGGLVLVRPDAARLEALARARPFADDPRGGPLRALPALAKGRLYLRNDRTLIALDVGR